MPRSPFDPDAVRALAVRGVSLDDVCRLLALRIGTLTYGDSESLHDVYGRARAQGAEAVAGACFERALHGDPRAQAAFLDAHTAWAATPTAAPGAPESTREEMIDRICALAGKIDAGREPTDRDDAVPSTAGL